MLMTLLVARGQSAFSTFRSDSFFSWWDEPERHIICYNFICARDVGLRPVPLLPALAAKLALATLVKVLCLARRLMWRSNAPAPLCREIVSVNCPLQSSPWTPGAQRNQYLITYLCANDTSFVSAQTQRVNSLPFAGMFLLSVIGATKTSYVAHMTTSHILMLFHTLVLQVYQQNPSIRPRLASRKLPL